MKTLRWNLLLLVVALFSGFSLPSPHLDIVPDREFGIGDTAPLPELLLRTKHNTATTLEQLKGKKGLLVVFSSNHCHYVDACAETYAPLYNKAKALQIGMVLINPYALDYADESLQEMILEAKVHNYEQIPYVKDESQRLTRAFGAAFTPSAFLLDSDLVLRYRGPIDDRFNNKDQKVKQRHLYNALEQLATDREVFPEAYYITGGKI